MKKYLHLIVLLLITKTVLAQTINHNIQSGNDTLMFIFKKGDKVQFSSKDGIRHYRKGKIIKRYKVVPVNILHKVPLQCVKAPCPETTTSKRVYYVPEWKRFCLIYKNNRHSYFEITTSTYPDYDESLVLKNKDWTWLD